MFRGIKDRIILTILRRKAPDVLGRNWKGRAGGVGMMLMGAAGILTGASCVIQNFTGEADLGLGGCWEQLGAGVALFSAGLACFGIRDAIGPSIKAK